MQRRRFTPRLTPCEPRTLAGVVPMFQPPIPYSPPVIRIPDPFAPTGSMIGPAGSYPAPKAGLCGA